MVKGKAPTRKVPTQQTVTKATEKQKVTAGSGKKRLQKGGNAARMDASNISTADLPWVTGATLPLDETAFPPADFGGCFTKEFNSPFQFGRRSSGRSRPQAKKTFEAAGFQFTFEAKAVFNKERAPYDPSQSLVSNHCRISLLLNCISVEGTLVVFQVSPVEVPRFTIQQ